METEYSWTYILLYRLETKYRRKKGHSVANPTFKHQASRKICMGSLLREFLKNLVLP